MSVKEISGRDFSVYLNDEQLVGVQAVNLEVYAEDFVKVTLTVEVLQGSSIDLESHEIRLRTATAADFPAIYYKKATP